MTLTYRMITDRKETDPAWQKLYERSFPASEQIPWPVLASKRSDSLPMIVFYDGSLFIGFAFTFLYRDMAYLEYLTVDERLREQGYGSSMLGMLEEILAGRRIIADIEMLNEAADNYTERKRRRDFYLRQGFVPSGVFYHIYGVDYELLLSHGSLAPEEFGGLLTADWGTYAKDASIWRDDPETAQ